MSELRQRVAAAAVLLPLMVAAVLLAPTAWFALLLAAFCVVGAWEWAGLAGWRSGRARLGFAAVVAASLALLEPLAESLVVVGSVLVAGVVWWVVAGAWIVRYQRGARPDAPLPAAAAAACGWLTLVPCWLALRVLHALDPQGPALVLALLAVIWSADIGAYFAGKRWGRRRLASRVSPGKSWEGLAGALAVVALLGIAISLAPGIVYGSAATFVVLCIATALISVVGDLAESLFKRRAGVKDSGVLIPGHGGVLDRIDSITAAAPCFVLGLALHGGWI